MSKIQFSTSLDAVADLAGTIQGVTDSINDADYIDGLVKSAHAKAAEAFDLAAAATAGSGYLTHVYEYGVAGITRGKTQFTDPTSPAARLYVHRITGRRGSFDINYYFRPAVVRNPQPTTAYTGVPSKYLRKLSRRKYVFRQRAYVMETGMEVEIKPTRGNLLFVPFYRQQSSNPLNKKGFMMYPYAPRNKAIKSVPGHESKGTFTSFWQGWWGGTGENMMTQDIDTKIRIDVAEALRLSALRAANESLEPVQASSATGTSKQAQAKTKANIAKKSQARKKAGRKE